MFKFFFVLVAVLLLNSGFVVKANALGNASNSVIATSSSPDVIIPPVNGPSIVQSLQNRAKSAWPWYVTRAAGMVAAILLVILIISGVGLITGYSFKVLEPLNAWATHRAVGIAFFVAVLVHGVSLLFDKYVPFSISQTLVPFSSNYRDAVLFGHHLGSLYVAFGILAFYGLLAIIITSFLWIDKRPHTWKSIHFLSYLILLFVFIHALYIGTDLMSGLFRYIWIAFGIITFALIIYRLTRSRSI